VHEKYTYMDYFRMLIPCFVTCVIINSIFHTCTFKIYIVITTSHENLKKYKVNIIYQMKRLIFL